MKKRVNRKSSASPRSPNQSPKSIISNKNKAASTPKHNFKNQKQTVSALFISPSPSPSPLSPTLNNNNKSLSSVSDLKEMASSRFDDLKRNLIDRSHSEILKDLEASHSRLNKRLKIQTQTCQQMMDEAEKEYKKMLERIGESEEAMKASYAEFMDDAQVTLSSVSKTSIPELSRSFEKAISTLQSRYGVQST
ncbi:Kinesin-like protein [Melia azedarach]|uniref:Kinesin-like protein n=1 Tax=Melia azedarach TaxID=155640 RepID=A0ACC1YZ16_MELAZ|nr:Kinesin-like protein [Melia azedarach]